MRTFTRTPLNQFANDVLTFIHFRHLTGLIDARSLHFQTPSAVGVLQAAIVKILNDTQRHDRERFRQLIALMFEIGGYEEVVRLSQLPPAAGNPPILCACRGGTTHATGCPLAP